MIFAITNQKGGVGKSTTAAAIATGATYKGKRSLAIDLDGQATLTVIMNGDPQRPGMYEVMTGEAKAIDVIQRTSQGDLLSSNYNLTAADVFLTGDDRVFALKRALKDFNRLYDVIVLDCPPQMNTLLLNALTAADTVIIPTRAKMVCLQGLYLLVDTIKQARDQYNKKLKIGGVLFTEFNSRTNAAKSVYDEIIETAGALDVPVYQTAIRQGVAVDEAQILQRSLFEYAPKSNPAQDYLRFLDEIGV